MGQLRRSQKRFADAVLTGSQEFEQDVVDQGGISIRQRVDIYRHAYSQRLRACIETDHEVLGLYLGDELFEQMVPSYVETHPSSLTSLRNYCDGLPLHLQSTLPFSDSPQIAEIAKFERNLLTTFDAPDGPRMNRKDLLAFELDGWPDLRVEFHPSVNLFKCAWNSVQIWQAIKAGQKPPDPTDSGETRWLIWRNHQRLTQFRSLSPDEVAAIECLTAGGCFADMCHGFLDFVDESDVGQHALDRMFVWLDEGVITSF